MNDYRVGQEITVEHHDNGQGPMRETMTVVEIGDHVVWARAEQGHLRLYGIGDPCVSPVTERKEEWE